MKMSSSQRQISSKNKKGVGEPPSVFPAYMERNIFPPAEAGTLAQRAPAESSCCMLCSVRVGCRGNHGKTSPPIERSSNTHRV